MGACPKIARTRFGEVVVGEHTYTRDVYILADGTVKKRKKKLAKQLYGTSHVIGPKELDRLCKGRPQVVFVGTGQYGAAELADGAADHLRKQGIECRAMPTPDLLEAYNRTARPKAALIHVTC
jgi:hypothetical protein